MEFKLENNRINITLSTDMYSLKVLNKCFYWYSRDFEVEISGSDAKAEIVLVAHNETSIDLTSIRKRVKQDLIDFNLRETIQKETQTIRELMIAKAFANYNDEDNSQLGEISDPVGFDPKIL